MNDLIIGSAISLFAISAFTVFYWLYRRTERATARRYRALRDYAHKIGASFESGVAISRFGDLGNCPLIRRDPRLCVQNCIRFAVEHTQMAIFDWLASAERRHISGDAEFDNIPRRPAILYL
jgi:hypothetical protein